LLYCDPSLYPLVGFSKPDLKARWVNRKMEKSAFKVAPATSQSNGTRPAGIFAREIQTEISIAAPAEAVWNCLMAFDRYPDWNPMLHVHEIERQLGGRVKFSVRLGSNKRASFEARISRDDGRRRFAWRGGNPLAVGGEHYFELSEGKGGTTRFIHGERFSGLLLPAVWSRIAKSERLYRGMNEALKQRAEAYQSGEMQ
jgi:hypothetical protein